MKIVWMYVLSEPKTNGQTPFQSGPVRAAAVVVGCYTFRAVRFKTFKFFFSKKKNVVVVKAIKYK
jgi:hypothetical protein